MVHLANALNCLLCSCVFTGAHHLTSPPSQTDSLLAMFDPLSSAEGNFHSQNAPQPFRARHEYHSFPTRLLTKPLEFCGINQKNNSAPSNKMTNWWSHYECKLNAIKFGPFSIPNYSPRSLLRCILFVVQVEIVCHRNGRGFASVAR